ncbi:hypothetical protein B7486_02255 [cyanobacterium TDX16]|nr:hypothetical protein B7486_02255 [cyanobacterium TDX16]
MYKTQINQIVRPPARCVTFPAHFSKTYKRTSPKFFAPIRAFTRRVSPCPFSPKTAKNTNRPNTRSPQRLQASAQTFFAYCHLRFCETCARAGAYVFTLDTPAPQPIGSSASPCVTLVFPKPRKANHPLALGVASARRPMTIMPDPHGQGPEPGQLGKD